MNFYPTDRAPGRLDRSALAVPGSQPRMCAKAPNEIDRGARTSSGRINGLDTHAAGTRARPLGGATEKHPVLTGKDAQSARQVHRGGMRHHALPRLVVAVCANGLRPIGGPFGDFAAPEGYKAAVWRAAVPGCEGRRAIHSSQVALVNEMPVRQARQIAA